MYKGVQIEVDAGYEGKEQVVLIEAKSFEAANIIIRQLFYPYRQWQKTTKKKIATLFFEKSISSNAYSVWQFEFINPDDYNSIKLIRSESFKIVEDSGLK